MLHSNRPAAIRVAVVASDAEWVEQLSKQLGTTIGAHVERFESKEALAINGHVPCHVLLISRESDPDLSWLHELRSRFSDQELPIIVADSDDDTESHQIDATRAGANAFLDRSIHGDNCDLLGKLVYGLARE